MGSPLGRDRSDFLEAVATTWSPLDPQEYPFTRGLAGQVRVHRSHREEGGRQLYTNPTILHNRRSRYQCWA
jgi:hypothetical protein